jgi:peptidoglycan DL-endopeptidase CwlO
MRKLRYTAGIIFLGLSSLGYGATWTSQSSVTGVSRSASEPSYVTAVVTVPATTTTVPGYAASAETATVLTTPTIPAPTTTTTEAPEPLGVRAVRAAFSQIGTAYRFATAIPQVGFDCSGLTEWAWDQVGLHLPRITWDQAKAGLRVTVPEAGDLLFFAGLGHVGIYTGRGTVIHAPNSGSVVSEVPYVAADWPIIVRPV